MSRTKSDKPTRVKVNFRVPVALLDRMEAFHRDRRERLAIDGVDRWTMTDSVCLLLRAGLRMQKAGEALDTPPRMRHK